MRPKKSQMLIGSRYLKDAIESSRRNGAALEIAIDLETSSLQVHNAKITWISWCTGDEIYGAIPIRHRNHREDDKTNYHRSGDEFSSCSCLQVSQLLKNRPMHDKQFLCQNEDEADIRELVRNLHRDENAKIIYHNGKFDLGCLISNAWLDLDDVDPSRIFDTLLASYVIDPVKTREKGKGSHGLKNLYDTYVREDGEDKQPSFTDTCNGKDLIDVRRDQAAFYATFDAFTTYQLYKKTFLPELKNPLNRKLLRYFNEIEMPHLLSTIEMTLAGMNLVSQKDLCAKGLSSITELEHERDTLLTEIFKAVGYAFNFNSHTDLSSALRRAGIGLLDVNKKSRSLKTDTSTLARRFRHENDGEKRKLIAYVISAKRSIESLKKHTEMYAHVESHTGKVHANFNSTTATGRYSASKPNVLSLSRSTAIKEHIFAGQGNSIITADFSQIDLRVIANETWAIDRSSKMLKDINNGLDLHLNTLRIVSTGVDSNWRKLYLEKGEVKGVFLIGSDAPTAFEGEKLEQITVISKRRSDIAKPVNFGIAYGLGAQGLLDNLNNPDDFNDYILKIVNGADESQWRVDFEKSLPETRTMDEVCSYLERFHRAYPGIKGFQEMITVDLNRDGFTYNLFGKRCKVEVATHFDHAEIDIKVGHDTWFRLGIRKIKMDSKFLCCVLEYAQKLIVSDPPGKKFPELKDLVRKPGFEVYRCNRRVLEGILKQFETTRSGNQLYEDLLKLHNNSLRLSTGLFDSVLPIEPVLIDENTGIARETISKYLYPFVKIPQRIIKFVRSPKDDLDLTYWGYDELRRQLISARIQSASMDFSKIAMIEFRKEVIKKWGKLKYADRPKIINCIHDEIAIECKTEMRDEVKILIEACMSNQAIFRRYVAEDRHLEVEIVAESKVGKNYAGEDE